MCRVHGSERVLTFAWLCASAQFRLDYALSREQTNKKGGKMYIQDKVRPR